MINYKNLASILLIISSLLLFEEKSQAQTPDILNPSINTETDGELPTDKDIIPLEKININSEEGEAILESALQIAEGIESPQEKAKLLREIADRYGNLGRISEAENILAEALDITESIDDNAIKASLILSIASSYNAIDRNIIARQILDNALTVTEEIDDSESKTSILTDLALKYNEIGEYEISRSLLSQTESIALKLQEPVALFPFKPIPLTGSFSFGSSFYSGNKVLHSLGVDFGLERKWATDQIDFNADFRNFYDDSRTEDENRIRTEAEVEYRHHFSPRWQYFVNSAVRKDDFQDIDIRTSLYTGPGINIWRGGVDRTFDMQLGLGLRYEESSRRDSDFDTPVAQYRLRYKDFLFGNWKLRQFLTFELPLNDTADYYINSTTNIKIPMTNRWSFSNFLKLRYAAIPTLENENLEIDLITGLDFRF